MPKQVPPDLLGYIKDLNEDDKELHLAMNQADCWFKNGEFHYGCKQCRVSVLSSRTTFHMEGMICGPCSNKRRPNLSTNSTG